MALYCSLGLVLFLFGSILRDVEEKELVSWQFVLATSYYELFTNQP